MVISGNITHTVLRVNEDVFISPLHEADAEGYWQLYQNALVQRHFFDSPFLPHEIPINFIRRIMLSCDRIWTVRKFDDPYTIIGDCALHNRDEQTGAITIGCALHPVHWGEGIMTAVMKHVIDFAISELGVEQINAHTSKYNDYAVRLMHRLGFIEKEVTAMERHFQLQLKD